MLNKEIVHHGAKRSKHACGNCGNRTTRPRVCGFKKKSTDAKFGPGNHDYVERLNSKMPRYVVELITHLQYCFLINEIIFQRRYWKTKFPNSANGSLSVDGLAYYNAMTSAPRMIFLFRSLMCTGYLLEVLWNTHEWVVFQGPMVWWTYFSQLYKNFKE